MVIKLASGDENQSLEKVQGENILKGRGLVIKLVSGDEK